MSDRLFFDTNILYYAFDNSEPDKQSIAQELLANAMASGTGCLSAQVLGEFFHATVVRRQLMHAEEAENAVRSLSALHVVEIDYTMVRTAITLHRQFKTSYWDSLILAAAKRSRCTRLITEDLNHNQDYNGVNAVNPFLRRNQEEGR